MSSGLTNTQLWVRMTAGLTAGAAAWLWSGWTLHCWALERANEAERKLAKKIGWEGKKELCCYDETSPHNARWVASRQPSAAADSSTSIN